MIKPIKKTISEDEVTRNYLSNYRKLKEEFETTQNDSNQSQDKNQITINENDQSMIDLKSNINKFIGSLKMDANAQILYPSQGDVVFNGMITNMNNLKFQFRYNDQSGGLYIWTDSMLLTKDISEKLAKLVTIKEQWSDYWTENISNY
jgi:hypothetical protein